MPYFLVHVATALASDLNPGYLPGAAVASHAGEIAPAAGAYVTGVKATGAVGAGIVGTYSTGRVAVMGALAGGHQFGQLHDPVLAAVVGARYLFPVSPTVRIAPYAVAGTMSQRLGGALGGALQVDGRVASFDASIPIFFTSTVQVASAIDALTTDAEFGVSFHLGRHDLRAGKYPARGWGVSHRWSGQRTWVETTVTLGTAAAGSLAVGFRLGDPLVEAARPEKSGPTGAPGVKAEAAPPPPDPTTDPPAEPPPDSTPSAPSPEPSSPEYAPATPALPPPP